MLRDVRHLFHQPAPRRKDVRTRHRWATVAALAVGTASLAGCNADAGTGLWLRDHDPVVLTGGQVGDLVGVAPGSIVAFRWNGDAALWDQVPVQVDQRHQEFLSKLRNGSGTTGTKVLAYSDPTANAGADPVPTFDADDEIAFMVDDTGAPAAAGAGNPAGVVAGSGVAVTVRDPLVGTSQWRGNGVGHVYLFQRSGSLDPSRGGRLRRLRLRAVRPDGARGGLHGEHRPLHHPLLRRWTRDEITLGTGPDILDRHRNLFFVGYCARSEDTFSAGDGGFATNIDGPVRVDPLVPGREQRDVHAAGAPLLPGDRTRADVPARARRSRGSSTSTTTAPPPSACATRARPRRGSPSTACPTWCPRRSPPGSPWRGLRAPW